MNEHTHLVYKEMPSPVGLIRLIASDASLAAILWESSSKTLTLF